MTLPHATEVPRFDSAEEAADWYDTHDTSDLPGEVVEVEPVRQPMVSRSIRFDLATMRRLSTVAERHGVGVTQLMREWVEARLETEEALASDDEPARVSRALLDRIPAVVAQAYRDASR